MDTLLLVRDTNGHSDKDQTVTASDNILRGMWIMAYVQGGKPLWWVYLLNLYRYCIMCNYKGPSWPWSYGSWIYNYLYYECLSPLMLWVRISIRARYTTLCDKVCQWLATGRLFSPGPPDSSTNKTDHHDITEVLLKVVLNTIKQTNKGVII